MAQRAATLPHHSIALVQLDCKAPHVIVSMTVKPMQSTCTSLQTTPFAPIPASTMAPVCNLVVAAVLLATTAQCARMKSTTALLLPVATVASVCVKLTDINVPALRAMWASTVRQSTTTVLFSPVKMAALALMALTSTHAHVHQTTKVPTASPKFSFVLRRRASMVPAASWTLRSTAHAPQGMADPPVR